jgi:hypothetical protein
VARPLPFQKGLMTLKRQFHFNLGLHCGRRRVQVATLPPELNGLYGSTGQFVHRLSSYENCRQLGNVGAIARFVALDDK